MKIAVAFLFVVLQLTATTSKANAQPINVFSFAGRNWSPNGTLTEGFTFAGGNVNFNVTGSTANRIDYSGTLTPDIFNGTFGGLGVSNSVLALAMNQPNDTNTITNSISFTHGLGIQNVSFRIFDIDEGSYQDQVTVTVWNNGVQLASSNVTVSAHNPTYISVTGTNVVRGINGSVNDTGAGSGLGNATFQVNYATIIDRIDITYGNGPTADNNPGQQWIFLSDISFQIAVPEPGTYALLGVTGFFGLQWYLRRKKATVKQEETTEKSEEQPVMPAATV